MARAEAYQKIESLASISFVSNSRGGGKIWGWYDNGMNQMLPQELDSAAYRLWCSDEGAAREFVADVATGELFERFANHPPDAPTEIGAVPTGMPLAVLPPAIAGELNPILLFKASVARKQLKSRAGDKNFSVQDYAQVQFVFDKPDLLEDKHKSKRYVYCGTGANGKQYKAVIDIEASRWVLVSFHRLPKEQWGGRG